MTGREQFLERNLRGARFAECDLSGVVMRGVLVAGMDIDAPWLSEGPGLQVNGVDVAPFVEQELDRRFPGRSERRAESPAGLRAAWETATRSWDAAIDRAAALPAGSVDVRVDDEWSFAETLGVGYGGRASEAASFDDVLAARADRVAMVRDYLATVTDQVLDEERRNPHNPEQPETVRQCLHVILEESWEHLRFALGDLNAIEQPVGPS